MTNSKGSATPLSELLPLDQIAKAAQHIKDAIRERSNQQEELKAFAEENKALRKLVQELPHKVSHKIMVPFGKAAFFPGQLVHTNELMVLLGEGYYAEQSAKQTVEILKRRGKYLDSKIEALQTQISNLQTEASFANEAAMEAAAGFVEIREDYVERTTQPFLQEAPAVSLEENDEAHERIMAALADLEAEEAAFEARQEGEDNAVDGIQEDDGFGPLGEGAETTDIDAPSSSSVQGPPVLRSPADFLQFEEWKKRSWELEKKETSTAKPVKKVTFAMPDAEESIGRKPDRGQSRDKALTVEQTVSKHKAFTGSIVEQAAPAFRTAKAFTGSVVEQTSRDKAFTGLVVEHSATDAPAAFVQPEKEEPTKPLSRFRMRRPQ